MKKSVLDSAKAKKNDEFYTKYETVERELKHYHSALQGKRIYLNCDNLDSRFYTYFQKHFEDIGLESITVTGIFSDVRVDYYGAGREKFTTLPGVGDFKSVHCIDILGEIDVVVTNPPFSLARDLIDLVLEHDRDFILLGTNNWATYKNVYPRIQENVIKMGANTDCVEAFDLPDGSESKLGFISWYTTLESDFEKPFIPLVENYNVEDYPKYDNFDAVNTDSIKDIPSNFSKPIGVPVTILGKLNPNQFDIITIRKGDNGKDLTVDGKPKYFRVVIKER